MNDSDVRIVIRYEYSKPVLCFFDFAFARLVHFQAIFAGLAHRPRRNKFLFSASDWLRHSVFASVCAGVCICVLSALDWLRHSAEIVSCDSDRVCVDSGSV
jgi:hypothetical protein